jgi:hypothetical protein
VDAPGSLAALTNGIVGVKTLSGFLHEFEKDKLQFFVMWQHTFAGVLAS